MTHPQMVAILICNDQECAEGLGVLQGHGSGRVQLREAGNCCHEGVAQHVHA